MIDSRPRALSGYFVIDWNSLFKCQATLKSFINKTHTHWIATQNSPEALTNTVALDKLNPSFATNKKKTEKSCVFSSCVRIFFWIDYSYGLFLFPDLVWISSTKWLLFTCISCDLQPAKKWQKRMRKKGFFSFLILSVCIHNLHATHLNTNTQTQWISCKK